MVSLHVYQQKAFGLLFTHSGSLPFLCIQTQTHEPKGRREGRGLFSQTTHWSSVTSALQGPKGGPSGTNAAFFVEPESTQQPGQDTSDVKRSVERF